MAAVNGHGPVVQLLLAARAVVDPRADDGATALDLAAMNDYGSVMEQLLMAGAPIYRGLPKYVSTHKSQSSGRGLGEFLVVSGADIGAEQLNIHRQYQEGETDDEHVSLFVFGFVVLVLFCLLLCFPFKKHLS